MKKNLLSASEIQTQLESITPGNNTCDKVQRKFILAMLERCNDKSDATKHVILEKTTTALQQYRQGKLATPAPTGTMQQPQEQSSQNTEEKSSLAFLIELLEHNASQNSNNPTETPLDDILLHMDKLIMRTAAPKLPENTASNAVKPAKKSRHNKKMPQTPAGGELKATRQARKIQAMDKALKMVDDINEQQLENPGPLNPQMLTTRAITLMRNISPAYINRFLTQLDTIFWLESD